MKNNTLAVLVALFLHSCSGYGQRQYVYANPMSVSETKAYYEENFKDTGFQYQVLIFKTVDKDGFHAVDGTGIPKLIFRDKQIKMTDSIIYYKVSGSQTIDTFLDCGKAATSGKFETKIRFPLILHQESDQQEQYIVSVKYVGKEIRQLCGKSEAVYLFELSDQYAHDKIFLGVSINHGITALGYSNLSQLIRQNKFGSDRVIYYLKCKTK